MPFPDFRAGSRKILFFSRGRGRGHAAIDLELAERLGEVVPELDVRFVSYADGAQAIAATGKPLIDLDLPIENSYVDTAVLAGKVIGWLDPDIVVSHEEFAAVPAAKIFDKPVAFLTDWFTSPDKLTMASLRHADEILFLEEPGIFSEPDYLSGRVSYLGPYFREFSHSREDRSRVRHQLGLPPHATILGVFPGSWRESATPLAGLVEECLPLLEARDVYVLWLAGEDARELEIRFAMKPRFLVRKFETKIDALMVCCDAALTKCNRKSVMELVRLGIPSVAISWGFNPIDDIWVRRREEVAWVPASNLSAGALAKHIDTAIAMRNHVEPWTPSSNANKALVEALTELLSRTGAGTSA